MHHRIATKKFNRTANQRKALFRSLISALIIYERIETTLAKAKTIRGMTEKMVTLGKRGDLHSKRLAMADLPNRKAVAKLFATIAPRFVDRNGGYLRIVKTRRRLKDQAELAVIEFVDYVKPPKEEKETTK
ncbi:MAG: 50S ribosomal protein L17 [Candidatus Magnetobacterium sp. LHC-1]|uniref:50S ribosomal protein L17 n=1 Tax=Candidatus Magnetobacterium casense TaxID=1455061 RepID=UPI0021000D7D|nr:50S ribosomal protein L17 [Candidatus Magnetobacterium casensis]